MAYSSDIMTSNPKTENKFLWRMDSLHLIDLKEGVSGPTFQPIPWTSHEFDLAVQCIERNYSFYFLVDLKAKAFAYCCLCFVQSNITLSIGSEEICSSNKDSKLQVHRITNLIKYDCDAKLLKKFDSGCGKLKLHGSLTFTYSKVFSSCSLVVEPVPASLNCPELLQNAKTMSEGAFASETVTFHVGGKKLSVHKDILRSHSPALEKLFEHETLEKKVNEVDIEGVDFPTFNNLLTVLYTGVITVDRLESLLSLYSALKKYQVTSRHQEFCSSLVADQLTVEHACDTLVLADLHEDEELKGKVKIFIIKNSLDLVGTSKWTEFVNTNPGLAQEVVDYMKASLHNSCVAS